MAEEAPTFRHEAVLYADEADFVASMVPFVREGVEAGEPVLVAAVPAKLDLLRTHLGRHADSVLFTDMSGVGANPSRIIPVWRQFVREHARGGRRLRGIGEPVWKGRTPAELAECERHEALLNVAFADSPPLWLVCPYDSSALDPAILEEARHTHPLIWQGDGQRESHEYDRVGEAAAPMDAPLPDPPGQPPELRFDANCLSAVRRRVSRGAIGSGLGVARTSDLVLAVNEVATNSIHHGGGGGVLRVWEEAGALICELRDRGRLSDPMIGRVEPPTADGAGWGLWLVNQLCDLVQLRSFATGTVVRMHMRLDRPPSPAWQPGADLHRPDGSQVQPSGSESVEALPIAMHEIRRPLGLALSYLSILGEETANLAPGQLKLLREAVARLSDLRRQLDQLGLLSRVLAGSGAATLEACDVEQAIAKVVADSRREIELAGGQLRLQKHGAPVRALADPALLQRVVDNLLNNAIKYSEGAPDLQLEIGSTPRPYLRVIDHGMGMDQETAAAIFHKGFRGQTAHRREGSGLGLFLSNHAVSRMNGELVMEWTEPGTGSSFRLDLQPELGGRESQGAG